MRKHTRTPFNNQRKFIPKDRRVALGQIHPVDHYSVTSQDITVSDGSSPDLGDPNNPPSGGDGGTGNIEESLPAITSVSVTPESINVNEPSPSAITLTVAVTVNLIQTSGLTYQWQKQESGTSTWTDISGETNTTYDVPAGLTVAADEGDKFRCSVGHPDAVTSPKNSNEVVVDASRVITITTEPTSTGIVPQGSTETLTAAATVTSGTLDYKWQNRPSGSTTWADITGASGTGIASGTTVTYTTPSLVVDNNGDQYRIIFSADQASDVISQIVTLTVGGADFRVEPPINNIEFWSLADDGPLIFDPSNAVSYTITSLEPNRTKFSAKMWGQGSCSSEGGHSYGEIPVSGADQFTIALNAGRGISGSGQHGGGYAGIFDGTVSQANALMIAGGAGSGGDNGTNTCGNAGGDGGGASGGDGTDYSANLTGGDGGTQSAGGAGGVASGSSAATTFNQTYTSNTTLAIPAGVLSVTYTIHGGKGGQGGNSTLLQGSPPTFNNMSGGTGGKGQKITGILTGVGGSTLDIITGNNGGDGSGTNGINTGGASGSSPAGYPYSGGFGGSTSGGETWGTDASGGGGGAASIISIGSSNILAIAGGGGGGGGAASNSSFPAGDGFTSSQIGATIGSITSGYTGGSGQNANGGAGGGGGGSVGGYGGPNNHAGNHIGGAGGNGGDGYYNPNYHASASTLVTSDSNTSYIEISYTVQGDSGDDGSALQGGNGSGSGASYTNETVRTGDGSLTEKPSCTNTQNGWYTRSGGSENLGNEGVRALQILWGGTLIYDGGASGIVDGYVVVGNYAYTWGTHRGSNYGWCNNDDCGTCGSGAGDYGNGFDVKRYDYAVTSGGGAGGGGYYGGGGGSGGSSGTAGGGGGSGYIDSTLSNAATSAFAASSDTDRGTAGSVDNNSRIVINDTYIVISQQPSGTVAAVGDTPTLSVTAAVNDLASATISYQWQKKISGTWTDISGATSSSYTIPSLTTSDAGSIFRCVMGSNFTANKISDEAVILISTGGSQTYTLTTPGQTTIPIPSGASDFTFWLWGSGGQGQGECPSGSFSGGSGGFATGKISNLDSTDSLTVFVGASGLGSPVGQSGYGAGRGGQRSELLYTKSGNSANWYVGGGGGAGQNGNGGYGGGNGSGGAGTGPNTGVNAGTTGRSGGGAGGGSGTNQGNRGGGGGSGWSGGAGAGGDGNGNCTGGGGGGGSGNNSISTNLSVSQTAYSNGSTGGSSGAAAPQNTIEQYVTGHGGSGQDGLAVVALTVLGSLSMTGVNTNTITDITSLSTTTTLSEPVYLVPNDIDYNVTVRLRGGSPSGTGGYVQATVRLVAGNTYRLNYNSQIAAMYYGTGTQNNNCILLAAQGGYAGNGVSGGNAGYPSGSAGANKNNSGGGGGGTTSGYRSGSGGNGGYGGGDAAQLSSTPGGAGGFFSSGNGASDVDGSGGNGGMGYYGGGGGGSGWDYGSDYGGAFGGGGGGGSSYIGGLPSPSVNSNSPYEVTVSNPTYGTESGGTQIQIISVAEA